MKKVICLLLYLGHCHIHHMNNQVCHRHHLHHMKQHKNVESPDFYPPLQGKEL
jgi:hypothetical protein